MSATSIVHEKVVELGKLVLRMTTAAGSGHPSSALALGHIVYALMYKHMRYDSSNPWDPRSDRLVLSAGHAVPIVYAACADLHGAVGSDPAHPRLLEVGDLMELRELSSVLDGHPNPAEGFPFFDAATGSLGQGLSVAAGLALGARLDGIEKRIYTLIGDGEAREGQVWEAMDFVVDHGLSTICAIFSCNGHGQAAEVSPQQSADRIAAKAAAFGWEVEQIDGHDPEQIDAALERFKSGDGPLAVIANTVKGWGVDLMIGENYHGKPLPSDRLDEACAQLDRTAARLAAPLTHRGQDAISAGRELGGARHAAHPVLTKSAEGGFRAGVVGSAEPTDRLPPFEAAAERAGMGAALQKRKMATRAGFGVALVALGDVNERVVALDGDVSNSTYADRFARIHAGRFFECKIAEQNMISVGAGLSAAGFIPFASSFGKFIARAVDQIDMAGISRANLKIVGSHAGVSLAADGPSQMALSDLAYFRSMTRTETGGGGPLCRVFHPADAVAAYRCTEQMARVQGMCYLRTHRPDAPFLYPFDEPFELAECKKLRHGDRLTLASSGYMLHTVLAAADRLAEEGIACNVFDVYTFPLDPAPILSAARSAGGAILTVEDNYLGGLHAELAEAAAQGDGVRVYGMTATRIPKSARTAPEVFTYVGVGSEQIMKRVQALTAG